jgi:2-hydroxy-3-keto-5-methylthiopentenyl-1-phosphate phosphatase
VLAKGALLDHCRTARLSHLAFEDFNEASLQFAAWLEGRQYAGMDEPAPRAED